MEATTRQLNYIQALAKRAGKDIDTKQVQGLSKEEASRTIDQLQEEVGDEDTPDKRKGAHSQNSEKINDARFGLAAKLVWRRYLATRETPDKDRFPDDVIETYKQLTSIREKLKKKLEARPQ